MFEARLAEGYIFKRIVEAIGELVCDVNLDVSPSGKYNNLINLRYIMMTKRFPLQLFIV